MANEKQGSAIEVPQRTEELEVFALDQAGDENEITSLVGLEDVPVFSSTDELTGEELSGWGFRQRDLRPDGLHCGPSCDADDDWEGEGTP